MGKIGIKISKQALNTEIIKIVRKYRKDISIAEIKRIVSDESYLYECDYIDAHGIVTALKLNNELKSSGVTALIFEHDRITTVGFLRNLLDSYRQIALEVEAEMDSEALTDNDN